MAHRRLKLGYFAVEGINAFATFYYASFLFFFMQSRFGFGDLENLRLCALSGLVYLLVAWFGGWFAQRAGYFVALRLGIGIMTVVLLLGAWLDSAAGQVAVLIAWTFGICFTWPTLEALVCVGEPRRSLPRILGIYNLVWATGSAMAYFLGGAMFEAFGAASIFLFPALLHMVQWVLVERLAYKARVPADPAALPSAAAEPEPEPEHVSPAKARMFLRLAWLANPFAYVAINTVIAVVPGLARKHGLSPMWAGFFCAVWLFARLGTFALLWQWPRWHYRFRWFLGSFVLLIGCFALILLSPSLWLGLAAQIGFGAATGLIYYSSLFYSMDVGESQGDHGGIHESAIGAGLFAGPAVGALALTLAPHHPNVGALAVSGLLVVGLLAFVGIRVRTRVGSSPAIRASAGPPG